MLRRTTTSTGFVPELRQRLLSKAQKPVSSSLAEAPPSLHGVAPEQLPYSIRAPMSHVAHRCSTRPPRLVWHIHRGAMSSSNSNQEFRYSGRPLLPCLFYAFDVFTHSSWRNVETATRWPVYRGACTNDALVEVASNIRTPRSQHQFTPRLFSRRQNNQQERHIVSTCAVFVNNSSATTCRVSRNTINTLGCAPPICGHHTAKSSSILAAAADSDRHLACHSCITQSI